MHDYVFLSLGGLVAGIASGLLGIGGGVIAVPLFILALNLEPKIAVGTSLFVIVPTAIVGMIVHYMEGNINIKYGLIFLTLSLIGAFAGARLTAIIPADLLKKLFALIMIIISIKMLIGK